MPLSSHSSPMNTNVLCQHYLQQLYHQAAVHGLHKRQNKSISETYGEILYPSVAKLLTKMQLTDTDVFADLGSGLGKLVLQAFLTTSVKAAVGIEIIPELHQRALNAAYKVQQDLPAFYAEGREVTFLQGSFLEVSLVKASVILIGSPCFSPKLLASVGTIINRLPRIRLLMSLRPMVNLRRLAFKETLRIEGSWDTSLCYLYR